jgi:phosphoesterase RecJ-like protein
VITTHESPDADGLGAEIAFLELLRHLGKKSMILNGDPTPEKYYFMDVDNDITWLSDRSVVPEDIGNYALIILDTRISHGNTYRFLQSTLIMCAF